MKRIILALLIVTLSGCSLFKSSKANEDLNRPLKIPEGSLVATEVPQQLSREKLVEYWKKSPRTNSVRMVEVYDRSQVLPRHWLFDVRKGSVYELIGLKERDIVVAADDFLIYDPAKFVRFIQLMPTLPEAKLLIEREGTPLLMKYSIQ